MNHETAKELADGYCAYLVSGDGGVFRMFSESFFDNVSGRSGLEIFQVVGEWLDTSLDQRSADLHLVTHSDDTVVVWCTVRGRHVGNGFPRLTGKQVKETTSTGLRSTFFRFADGSVVEHWAVRDDIALLESVEA
jgi:hypothetical protein